MIFAIKLDIGVYRRWVRKINTEKWPLLLFQVFDDRFSFLRFQQTDGKRFDLVLGHPDFRTGQRKGYEREAVVSQNMSGDICGHVAGYSIDHYVGATHFSSFRLSVLI